MTGPRPVSCILILSFAAQTCGVPTSVWRPHSRIELEAILLFRAPFAWFHTIWACLLWIIFAFLLAWFVLLWRIRRIEAALGARFHERLSERTRAARDINDTLLQTIEASKMIADDALDPSADATRMRLAMGRLSAWLGKATQEGQAALDSLRTVNFEGNDLASGFRRAAEECLMHRSTEFALSVTGESRDMHPLVRDEVYRIGYEAISSACKHAGSHLEVALTYGSDFCLRVRDDGNLMDPIAAEQSQDGRFDLEEVRQRAKRFGAMLSLSTSPSSGTELTLTVPGGIIFRQASSILPYWLAKLRDRLWPTKGNPR
jgi:signal transduction histidine kinase